MRALPAHVSTEPCTQLESRCFLRRGRFLRSCLGRRSFEACSGARYEPVAFDWEARDISAEGSAGFTELFSMNQAYTNATSTSGTVAWQCACPRLSSFQEILQPMDSVLFACQCTIRPVCLFRG